MKLWLMVFLLVVSMPSVAMDAMNEIRQRVGTPDTVRGLFEQKKQITALERPLISKGEFLVVRNRGVLWRTVTPFPQVLKLTRREIVHEQSGKIRFQLSAEREPAVKAVNQVLFALFAGDFAALEQSFASFGKVEGERWQVTLTSKEQALAQLFKEIRLEGGNTVQKVELFERNGDRTEIRFREIKVNSALSADEGRLFD